MKKLAVAQDASAELAKFTIQMNEFKNAHFKELLPNLLYVLDV